MMHLHKQDEQEYFALQQDVEPLATGIGSCQAGLAGKKRLMKYLN